MEEGFERKRVHGYDVAVINRCHVLMSAVSTRRSIKRKPLRGTLARYRNRIVEVLGEARGQRVMIRSIHDDTELF
jgi:hypothetical protein